MRSLTLTTILFFFLLIPASGENPSAGDTETRTSLEGPWKILIGDDSGYSLPDHNDSSWDETALPGSVTGYVRKKTGGIRGTLWLRKEVFIDKKHAGMPLGLILGRISNADETFFNGVKVGGTGSFPPGEFSMWNHPRHYPVPASIVRFGEPNTIAIRVSYFLYAGILGDIALAPHGQWRADEIGRRFSLITHSYLILSMALLLLVIFLTFYIARPDEQEYLFYCLQIFFGFFIVFDLCTYWNIYPSTYFRLQTVGISWVALNVAHLIFLHRIYRLERPRVEIALWAYLAVWILLVFLFARRDPVTYGIILILLCTVLGFYHISCHIYALVRGRPYARIFSVFGLTVILCSMHDSFVYLGMFYGKILTLFGYTFDRMIFHYGAFALFLGTALVLVYRFLTLREELDDLNRNLEKYIIEDAVLRPRGDDRGGGGKSFRHRSADGGEN